ncbi:unnamed protein product [Didymodactylos carnosus]|uniref:Uncharacterized protein n=1 Tax=Didymodactylos carnosus TaxID=1234261 RepID=A0A815A0X4_9BILA|nr:unnamed protein product [Didymodactylos carnosus]CAF1248598.1 unnamed protein product [Didymodactylos carnosus]CAF3809276.1 unnamed protein product [Didymodactylos carnosus]CAF4016453.1 unnamed protein product [Didymodactylos carnosus]
MTVNAREIHDVMAILIDDCLIVFMEDVLNESTADDENFMNYWATSVYVKSFPNNLQERLAKHDTDVTEYTKNAFIIDKDIQQRLNPSARERLDRIEFYRLHHPYCNTNMETTTNILVDSKKRKIQSSGQFLPRSEVSNHKEEYEASPSLLSEQHQPSADDKATVATLMPIIQSPTSLR